MHIDPHGHMPEPELNTYIHFRPRWVGIPGSAGYPILLFGMSQLVFF